MKAKAAALMEEIRAELKANDERIEWLAERQKQKQQQQQVEVEVVEAVVPTEDDDDDGAQFDAFGRRIVVEQATEDGCEAVATPGDSVETLNGIGPARAAKLQEAGLRTLSDLAGLPVEDVAAVAREYELSETSLLFWQSEARDRLCA